MRNEIIWMVCDQLETPRTEYGPYFTRIEAEVAAIRLHACYLLRYEQSINADSEVVSEQVSTIRFPEHGTDVRLTLVYTRCASCGSAERHDYLWQAEVWADIHEFENTNHKVRLFVRTTDNQLTEVNDWRSTHAAGQRTV
ncbi:MAG: hypothetical protein JO041_04525 [Acidobacteria bacterium]|nr:hypothetical protein [Acidobacteriota bacterium]